jgi:hypothetical protein
MPFSETAHQSHAEFRLKCSPVIDDLSTLQCAVQRSPQVNAAIL